MQYLVGTLIFILVGAFVLTWLYLFSRRSYSLVRQEIYHWSWIILLLLQAFYQIKKHGWQIMPTRSYTFGEIFTAIISLLFVLWAYEMGKGQGEKNTKERQ